MPDILLLAIIAGVLAIDDRAGWQSLLGEPVFSGLIVGTVTGQAGAGLLVGVVLQLVWLSIGAARGSRRPNVVVGGVVGAGVMCLGTARLTDYILLTPCAIFCGLLAGEAGRWVVDVTGRLRERWLDGFRLPTDANVASRNLVVYTAGSALYVGLVDTLVVLAALPLAIRLSDLMIGRIGGAAHGLWMWSLALPALAVAAIAHAFGTRNLLRFMLVGVLIEVVRAWLVS